MMLEIGPSFGGKLAKFSLLSNFQFLFDLEDLRAHIEYYTCFIQDSI